MGDLLDTAARWLTGKRHDHMTQTVTYVRGVQQVTLLATVAQNRSEQLDPGADVVNVRRERDYLFRAEDLTIGYPASGDKIVHQQGDTVYTFEVVANGGEPCWRWSDEARTTIRVHTHEIKREAA